MYPESEIYTDSSIYSNRQYDFGLFSFCGLSLSLPLCLLPRQAYSSQHRSNARTVPSARNCPEVYKWTACCSECGKIFLFIIQITHYRLPKKKRKPGIIRGLKPFWCIIHLIFSFDFFLFVMNFPFVVGAMLLPHNLKYPSHSLLIVFDNDFSNHHFHLALIKPFIGQRHGPLCSLYFRENGLEND